MNKTTKRACEMALDTAIEAVMVCHEDLKAAKASLPATEEGNNEADIIDIKLSTLLTTARVVHAIKEGILSGKVKMHKSVLGG